MQSILEVDDKVNITGMYMDISFYFVGVPRDLAVITRGSGFPPAMSPLDSRMSLCQPRGLFGMAWVLMGMAGL